MNGFTGSIQGAVGEEEDPVRRRAPVLSPVPITRPDSKGPERHLGFVEFNGMQILALLRHEIHGIGVPGEVGKAIRTGDGFGKEFVLTTHKSHPDPWECFSMLMGKDPGSQGLAGPFPDDSGV